MSSEELKSLGEFWIKTSEEINEIPHIKELRIEAQLRYGEYRNAIDNYVNAFAKECELIKEEIRTPEGSKTQDG